VSLLGFAERMERMAIEPAQERRHPQFTAVMGEPVEWQSGDPRLASHIGALGHWRKGGPPGVLVFCYDCPIRTRASKNTSPERIDADIKVWRLRHTRVAKAQLLVIKEEVRKVMEARKRLEALRSLLEIQGRDGNWDYSSYMCGLYNGLELSRATMEGDEPRFRSRPAEGWCKERATNDSPPGLPVSDNPVIGFNMIKAAEAGGEER
jgi:hypothetical protein